VDRPASILLESGNTFVECVAVYHGDGPVHDVRQARPLALQDGREVAERLPGLLLDRGTDDLPVGVDAVLPADVDRLRWLFDHDCLAEGRAAVDSLGVDVPYAHTLPPPVRKPVRVGHGRPELNVARQGREPDSLLN